MQQQTQEEICGAPTTDGGECTNNAESCPWHDENGNRTDKETGRPTKYNEKRVKKMIEAAKKGLPVPSIARAGGINTDTLYEWKERYPEFSERLKQARTEAELKLAEQAQEKDPRYVLTRSFKWDKPSADTVINNQMSQSQSQQQSTREKLAQYYQEKQEEETSDEQD